MPAPSTATSSPSSTRSALPASISSGCSPRKIKRPQLLLRLPRFKDRSTFLHRSFAALFWIVAPDPTRRGFMAWGDALSQAHRSLAMGMDVGGATGGQRATPTVVPHLDSFAVLIIIFMVFS